MSDQPAPSDLKQTAMKGAVWTVAGYGASFVLRFAGNLLLTRLLFPEHIGLMTLLNVFVAGLWLFSDIGLAPSIVRSPRGEDRDFLDSAFTLQTIRSALIAVLTLVIAWPLAQIFNQPVLAYALPVLGLASFISGFTSTSLFLINKKMLVKTQAIFDFLSQVLGLAFTLLWAWLWPSVWALVAGEVFKSILRTIWSHFLLKEPFNRFKWDPSAIKEIWGFGKWILISTAVTFLAGQTDRLIMGKLFTMEILGIFSIAFGLAEIPKQLVGALSGRVIFPALAQLKDEPRPVFREKLLRNRGKILLLGAAGLAVVGAFGDLVIRLLYDHRYEAATWMFPLLLAGVWVNILNQTIDSSLMAMGRPQYATWGNIAKFLTNAVGIPLAFHFYGLIGALAVIALNDLPYYISIFTGTHRLNVGAGRQDLKFTLLFLGGLALLVGGRFLLGFGTPWDGVWLHKV